MPQSHRTTAALALAASALFWGMSPIFIRLLSTAYDSFTQAFVRYASAAVVLTALCLVRHRAEFLALLRRPGAVAGLGLLVVVHQSVWTAGCYGAPATVAQLMTRLSTVFVVILAYVLFHEERAVIRSPLFLFGTAISLVALPLVLAGDPASLWPAIDRYAILLLLTALAWGVYAVWGKHLVLDAHPVPVFAVTALIGTLGLGILAGVAGQPASLFAATPMVSAVAFISGALSIGAAHPCFHYAQKYLGSAFCNTFNLTHPLLTYLLALVFLPGESLTVAQWAGAAVLLTGTLMVVRAEQRRARTLRIPPPA